MNIWILKAFFPVLAIKVTNLNLWSSVPFGIQINAHPRNSIAVRIGSWAVPWQNPTRLAKATYCRLGSPQVESGSLLQGFRHLQGKVLLGNDQMDIASHETITTIASPNDKLVLVGNKLALYTTTMTPTGIFRLVCGHVDGIDDRLYDSWMAPQRRWHQVIGRSDFGYVWLARQAKWRWITVSRKQNRICLSSRSEAIFLDETNVAEIARKCCHQLMTLCE